VKANARQIFAVFLGLLLAAHLILLGSFQLNSADTWWHLKQGELYVTTRSLPEQDPFAFTTAGREWIKYSWLADILFYLAFRAAGIPGLVFLRLLVLLLIALFLYRLLRACNLHPLGAVLLVFVASLALRFRLFIRPEILSFLLLLATVAVLLRLQAACPQTAYLLLPIQMVWTNIHASFVFGFGLPALVLLANLLPTGRAEPGWGHLRLDRVRIRHLAAATVLLPFSSLLNPQGARLLLFPFRQSRMVRLTAFYEWMEIWKLPGIDPAWWEVIIVLGLVLLAFATIAALLLAWEGRFDSVGWGIVLSMGTYALLRNRCVPYFVLSILPFLALAMARLTGHLSVRAPGRPSPRLERIGVLTCLILLSASLVDQSVLNYRVPLGFSVAPNLFPEGAVVFLERHRLDGRVFNSYEFGGYLIWRRWPANQIIIDGRYDSILFDQALLEAHMKTEESPAALNRITEAYEVEVMVLHVHLDRHKPKIDEYPGWARVYWDSVAEVFVRREGRYADLVGAHEYRLTGPAADTGYLAEYRRDLEIWSRAVAELRRAVADNPQNLMAWLGLAQEYRAAGPAAAGQRLEALARAATLSNGAPILARIQAERAEALFQLGRFDEATTAAHTALRMDGKLLLARLLLASVAERRGNWAEARDQLRTILRYVQPDNLEAGDLRRRLEAAEQNARRESGR